MKSILFCIVSTLIAVSTFAQETTKEKKPLYLRKNEIGLMGETGFGDKDKNMGFAGLQYKRWVKPYMGFRVIAAYGEYFERYGNVGEYKTGDTIIQTSRETTMPIATLGFGIEMQRKFYKRVHLFAAVELRGSYGKGSYNLVVSERIENNPTNNYSLTTFSPLADVNMISVMATPSIGAKLQFRKVCIGTELSAIQLGYSRTKYEYEPKRSEGMLDFNAGVFRQRFFVHYCF